jgi:hypothetical protein
MKINQVLVESASATVAFAFGRFNPAHQGHIEVWRTVEQAGANWFIGTNATTIGPNDPLTFQQKSAWMEEIYPPISGHIVPEQSVLTLAAYIFKKTRKNERATVAYITDETDWAWSGKLLNQYNGVEGVHGYYKFAQIIHEPSPRVSSATALRDAARADDKVAFYHASGTDPKSKVAGLTYFDTVKQAVEKYPLPVKRGQKVKEPIVAEGSDDVASATPAKNERGRFTAWDDDEPMRLKCEDGEFRTIQEINMLRQKIGMKPFSIKSQQGVAEGNLNEFAPGAGDEGGGEDPYKYPKPERYRRSVDFFGQFEADHFDREDMDDAKGEFKGYWGKDQIAYFKFDNPKRTGSDDPGMGWYYEPQLSGHGDNTSVTPAVDNTEQRKQQELSMIRAFLKSGNRPNPDSQIYNLMKRHGIAESDEDRIAYKLQWPELVNKVNSAMRAMGWKGQRKDDGSFMFITKGQLDDEFYIVIIDNKGNDMFTYALGTVEEGSPHIGEQDTLPNTEASISELMNSIREGFGLNENAEQPNNPYGYKVGQTVKLHNKLQGRVIDIFDDSIEVLLTDGRTVTVNFRDAEVLGEHSVAEAEQQTVAKTWDQMTSQEKLSGVKGRTVWNEKTQRYYTVFDVPIKQPTDEASLATMRDYFAGDQNAQDPTTLAKQRTWFDKTKDKNGRAIVDKRFRSPEEFRLWLKQNKLKQISGVKEDEEQGEVEQQGQLIPWPAGTAKVHVSDVYDWYKLGQVISDLDDANPEAFGQGAPQTVIAFGSEEEESKLMPMLKRLGLRIDDIDPAGAELDEAYHAGELYEYLKKVHGKWALVSKSNPKKVLQYYRGGDEKPSDEWVNKVERRVHSFESKKK